jgi:hypothetical protein
MNDAGRMELLQHHASRMHQCIGMPAAGLKDKLLEFLVWAGQRHFGACPGSGVMVRTTERSTFRPSALEHSKARGKDLACAV